MLREQNEFANVEEDRMADAVSYIVADTISDFKDYQFLKRKIENVYKLFYDMVSNRIKELGANTMTAPGMDAEDILGKYREHYSKAGDIKFLIDSYKVMNKEVTPKATSARMATPDPLPGSSQTSAEDMPSVQFGKPTAKRLGSVRRVVRFQETPEKIPDIPEAQDE